MERFVKILLLACQLDHRKVDLSMSNKERYQGIVETMTQFRH